MDYSELSKLMVKIRDNRDQIAFSQLFDFLAPKINGYYLQNGLIKDNAEELTQEVMSTIWSKSELYDATKASISTWVFTIARNKKVDFFRKNATKSLNEEDVRSSAFSDIIIGIQNHRIIIARFGCFVFDDGCHGINACSFCGIWRCIWVRLAPFANLHPHAILTQL